MNSALEDQYTRVIQHLYINPLEKCNLRCKICYTRKTSPILPNTAILEFIDRYQHVQHLASVTFCGGEVCSLKSFPELVNTLTEKGIFIQIITNGTIDILDLLHSPNNINMIVSIDGRQAYHDANRGSGNFEKSIGFLRKAHARGFHTEIFSIVTKQNYSDIDAFELEMKKQVHNNIRVTYHPRKPPRYLSHHPLSNIVGTTQGFDFLTPVQMKVLMGSKNTFPPKTLGCFQIAVASDGKVYGCCEGTVALGVITDGIRVLLHSLRKRLELYESMHELPACLGCSQPDFVCGIREYL